MSCDTPQEIARYLKGKKNVLVLAGKLCNDVNFNGKKLLDYAAEIAEKIGAPIAATGATSLAFKEKNARYKQMLAADVVNYLRKPWADSVMEQRPEVLVFIGYNQEIARRLISIAVDVETVTLGERYVAEATHSFCDANLHHWQHSLGELVQALG